MSKRKLPAPFVCIIQQKVIDARELLKALRGCFAGAKVKAFTGARQAWDELSRSRNLDPYLVIADSLGMAPFPRSKQSFIARMRSEYPRTPIVLFSESATDEEVVELQNRSRLIDWFLRKGADDDQLVPLARMAFRQYEQHPVLGSIRDYLFSCKEPATPFMYLGEQPYSLLDIYWEIIRGTDIGDELAEVWRLMQLDALNGKHKARESKHAKTA